MTQQISVVGLGHMGRAMLERLRARGLEARGYDQNAAITDHPSLPELVPRSDVIVLSLPDGGVVSQVVSNEIAPRARRGAVVIDCSTVEPETARQAGALLAEKSVAFLDAPVSGGRRGAETGALTILVGGRVETIERVRPVLDALATKLVHVGDVGAGQTAKLVNNLLVATQLLAVAEAVAIGEKAGVDADALLGAVNACSGRSAVSEINFPSWITNGAFDSGFSMGLMRKDVRLALELAAREGLTLRVTGAAGAIWRESESSLDDDADFNRIVEDA